MTRGRLARAHGRAHWTAWFSVSLGGTLRIIMVGDSFTLVDAYAAAAVGWATGMVRFELSTTPHLAAWLQRCMEREGAKQMK